MQKRQRTAALSRSRGTVVPSRAPLNPQGLGVGLSSARFDRLRPLNPLLCSLALWCSKLELDSPRVGVILTGIPIGNWDDIYFDF